MQTRDEIAARATKVVTDHFAKFHRKPRAPFTDDATLSALGADSLDTIEIIMAFEDMLNIEITDAEAEEIKTFGQAVDFLAKKLGLAAGDDVETCMACAIAFKEGDRVLNDASGGALHAACCGPERESYTNTAGDPLGPDDPIPEGYIWKPWPKRAVAA